MTSLVVSTSKPLHVLVQWVFYHYMFKGSLYSLIIYKSHRVYSKLDKRNGLLLVCKFYRFFWRINNQTDKNVEYG